jgi:hypothetical protein
VCLHPALAQGKISSRDHIWDIVKKRTWTDIRHTTCSKVNVGSSAAGELDICDCRTPLTGRQWNHPTEPLDFIC